MSLYCCARSAEHHSEKPETYQNDPTGCVLYRGSAVPTGWHPADRRELIAANGHADISSSDRDPLGLSSGAHVVGFGHNLPLFFQLPFQGSKGTRYCLLLLIAANEYDLLAVGQPSNHNRLETVT
jgi:hypothetical protein